MRIVVQTVTLFLSVVALGKWLRHHHRGNEPGHGSQHESHPGASCAVDQGTKRAGVVAPTPGSIKLDKSRQRSRRDLHQGRLPAQTTVRYESRFVGTTFANFIVGGGVGFIVDAASGANFKYPEAVELNLPPLAPASPGALSTPSGPVPNS